MIAKSMDMFTTKIRKTLSNRSCPECGASMMETERHKENERLFVWYQCSQSNCRGQWLQKIM